MTCVTGDETGLLKVWDIKRSSGAILKASYGAQGRTRGIAALAWVDKTTSQALISMNDGTLSMYDVKDQMMVSCVKRDIVAANAWSMQVVRDKLFIVDKQGRIAVTSWDDSPDAVGDPEPASKVHYMPSDTGVVEAVHIQRRYGLIAAGGKDNNLRVWSTNSERWDTPVFTAQNVRDHVLDVPYPIHVVGTCVVDPHIFGVATAYHDVRFYDRRLSERPVQEFKIDREIARRPTALMQWNCNKFLVSEASGDIHLYDTRRGFSSRAKLRGGVGSVRHMVKHPGGQKLLTAIGLDRKARVYHVPTGKLLASIYIKQKGTAVLMDNQLPFVDATQDYVDVPNAKNYSNKNVVPEKVWNEMDPVQDEFEDDDGTASTSTPSPRTPMGGGKPAKAAGAVVTPSPAPLAPAAAPAPSAAAASKKAAAPAVRASSAAKKAGDSMPPPSTMSGQKTDARRRSRSAGASAAPDAKQRPVSSAKQA